MRDLEIGRDHSVAEVGAAEAFSVGLTVLDATLLHNSEKLYHEDWTFKYEKFKSLKDSLKRTELYSNQLKYILFALT